MPEEKALTTEIDAVNAEYANNVYFEATSWDLKMLFGEWNGRSKSVEYHTSMTIPWAQAKLIAYFLQVNVAIHEANHGHIRVPENFVPLEFPDLEGPAADDPKEIELQKSIKALRDKFIASM
jgi:hypothetical protein